MLLQNNCKNNDVTNGLKQKKGKKKDAIQIYMVKQKRRERRGLIGNWKAHKTHLLTVTTQHKSRQRGERRVGAQASINDG